MRPILLLCFLPLCAALSCANALRAGEIDVPNPIRALPAGASDYSAALKDPAEKMALSPDGTRIVVGGSGSHIQLIDAASLKLVKEFDCGGPIASIDFSADGKEALTAGPGNDILVWNLETGKNTRKFSGHTGDVRAVASSPDGSRVASTDSVGTVRIWDFAEGKNLFTLTGKKYADDPPTEAITTEGLAYTPDGRFIITEANDVKARIWDAVRGVELRMVADHDGTTASVSVSPNGALAATSRGGGILRIWRVDTAAVVRAISGNDGDVTCSAFAMDDLSVFSGSNDMTLRQWDVETGLEIRRFKLAAVPSALACSINGKTLYSLSADAGIVAWDIRALPLSVGKFTASMVSPDVAWQALDSADYEARSDAMRFFVKHPDPAAMVTFLMERLAAGGVKETDRKVQTELIEQLDDPAYATRLKAAEDLQKMGRSAREALLQALKNPSSEVRQKAAELLRDAGGSSDARGVLVLEMLRMFKVPAAAEALKSIADQDGPNATRARAISAGSGK